MTKRDATVFVYMGHQYTEDYGKKEWVPQVWWVKVPETEDLIFIGEQTVIVEVPDDFNPVPAQSAVLHRDKLAALKEYQARVASINERLSKLLAITNEVVES